MADKVELIRKEIERIKNEEYGSDTMTDDVACGALDLVLDYINSLLEEPVGIC